MADDEELPPQPVWEGAFDEEGLPHGKGVMKYPPAPVAEDEEEKPGDSYEGALEHGKRHGQGKYTWGKSGAVYEGSYQAGQKHGQGKMIYPDRSTYEGAWVEDVIQGSGLYIYANGDLYQGEFQAGKRSGRGSYHNKTVGCQFVGTWEDGGFVEGHWILKDGSMFAGKFEKGVQPVDGAYFFSTSKLLQPGLFNGEALQYELVAIVKVCISISLSKEPATDRTHSPAPPPPNTGAQSPPTAAQAQSSPQQPMSVFNLYVFNRQGACVFYHEWFRPQTVQQGVGTTSADQKQMFGFIWTMCNVCVALDPKDNNKQQLGTPRRAGLGCRFHSCTTNNYKLHFLETPTAHKLVLNTTRETGDLRELLSSLYDEVLVEKWIKSPAYQPGEPVQHPEDFAQVVSVWLHQRGLL